MKLLSRFYRILTFANDSARFKNSINKVKEADIITRDIETRLKQIQEQFGIRSAEM